MKKITVEYLLKNNKAAIMSAACLVLFSMFFLSLDIFIHDPIWLACLMWFLVVLNYLMMVLNLNQRKKILELQVMEKIFRKKKVF